MKTPAPTHAFLWIGPLALLAGLNLHGLPANPGPETNSPPFRRLAWYQAERGLADPTAAGLARLGAWRDSGAPIRLLLEPAPGVAWSPIGPRPLYNTPSGTAAAHTGRVGDIAVDPQNPGHWLVGGAQGGIWETRDAGQTWLPRTDDQPSLAIGAIAFSPSQPLIVYAGTGEAVFSADAALGAGVIKSADGGQTWHHLAGSAAPFTGTTFSELKVDPSNPAVVIAATGRGVHTTVDGGNSWTPRLAGVATDVEVDPADYRRQYAGIGAIYGATANGVYRSSDAGTNWTLLNGPWEAEPGGIGRVELAAAPVSGIFYVSIQNRLGDGEPGDGSLLGLWSTTNAWAAQPVWNRLPPPPSPRNLWYNHDLIVAPDPSGTLFLGHLELHRYDGSTWTAVNGPMHVDMQALAWAADRLIVGNDGGVWSTMDLGETYANHNAELGLIQFYRGAIHAGGMSLALGGSQDTGSEVWRGTNGWRQFGAGDGAGCAISAGNSNHWAFSSQFLGIRRTRNGGTTSEPADAGIESVNRPFIGRLVKAPHRDDLVLTATHRVFRCTNFFTAGTVAWQAISPDFGSAVHALAFAPSDQRALTYAAGLALGGVRRTTNGGLTWQNADPAAQLPPRPVRDLRFHPAWSNIVYAAVGGTDPAGPACVFKTTNFGSPAPTWRNVSPPANISANTLVLDPTHPDTVWIGTDFATWRSRDGGTNWTRFGPETGMPNVEVDELDFDNHGRLVAFTHGRGAFQLVASSDADLTIHQSVSRDPAPVGCPLVISVLVSNRGPTAATNLTLLDRPPAGRLDGYEAGDFESATLTSGRLNFRRARLEVGATAATRIFVTPTNSRPLTNFLAIVAGSPDPNPANNASPRVVSAWIDTSPPQLTGATPGPAPESLDLLFDEPILPGTVAQPAWATVINGLGRSETVRLQAVPGHPQRLRLAAAWTRGPAPLAVTVTGATDCTGNGVVGFPGRVITNQYLPWIPAGAVWRHLDTGTNAGTAWRATRYDDSTWPAGPAPLGYGNGNEATVLHFGPDANAKYITTYFRQWFLLEDPTQFDSVQVRLRRDDGIAIYVNGVEAFRNQLPVGAGFNTPATVVVDGAAENDWLTWPLPPAFLLPGTNLVAAEVHQVAPASSDLTFELEAHLIPREVRPALMASVQSDVVVLSWPRSHPGWVLESSRGLSTAGWTTVDIAPAATPTLFTLAMAIDGPIVFFRLRRTDP